MADGQMSSLSSAESSALARPVVLTSNVLKSIG